MLKAVSVLLVLGIAGVTLPFALVTAVGVAALMGTTELARAAVFKPRVHPPPSRPRPEASDLIEAGMDLDQIFERCTSSEFGWCMRDEYMGDRKSVV